MNPIKVCRLPFDCPQKALDKNVLTSVSDGLYNLLKHIFLLYNIAILLLGEPVRWETNLQLIIDMLVTNGSPFSSLLSAPSQHIPIIVTSTDLVYVSEVSLPRYLKSVIILNLN